MKTVLVVGSDEVLKMIIKKLNSIFINTFSFFEVSQGQAALLALKRLASEGTPVVAVISEFKLSMSPINGAGFINQMNLQGYGNIPVFFLSTTDVADSIVLNYSHRLIKRAPNGNVYFGDLNVAFESLAKADP
ncbi:MAG: hypothetical protein RLY66_365 [Candidatus Parcubacteria bacterium]|jgi:hypothetical protein